MIFQLFPMRLKMNSDKNHLCPHYFDEKLCIFIPDCIILKIIMQRKEIVKELLCSSIEPFKLKCVLILHYQRKKYAAFC